MSDEIRFRYDPAKAREAVLWLLKHHNGKLGKMSLAKLLFLADREHLFRYGRPIIGARYAAMQHGPIPSEVLDDFKRGEAQGNRPVPFRVEGNLVVAERAADEAQLSQSDLEVLQQIDSRFGGWSASRLRRYTHSLKAYKKNCPDPHANTRHWLPYEDFFLDAPDDEMLDIIREYQPLLGV